MSEPHVALYRKYRPHTFKDVVGQAQVVDLLTSAIKHKKISHAYLFCGGRGTGKTTVARIVAREVGCNDEDIIEIDAASNRGIDEIRELREAVRTAPFSSPYKVYIIDEAHMLTKEAANALLKTLEEPPAHVIFILATTDPDKLPQTIVSRCQKVVFKNPDVETIAKRLVSIAKNEGADLDEASAEIIAANGKGSYRDSIGLLEQMMLIVKNNVFDIKELRKILGIPYEDSILNLLEALCLKDSSKIVEAVTSLKDTHALRSYDDLIDLVGQGMLARAGQTIENTEITRLAETYPRVIGSKLALALLEKRHLIQVSESHAWVAFEAILLSLIED